MLKSFKSFKSFKGDSNLLFQILCKSTAILLYGYEENIKKLLNRFFSSIHTPLIPTRCTAHTMYILDRQQKWKPFLELVGYFSRTLQNNPYNLMIIC